MSTTACNMSFRVQTTDLAKAAVPPQQEESCVSASRQALCETQPRPPLPILANAVEHWWAQARKLYLDEKYANSAALRAAFLFAAVFVTDPSTS